MPRYDYECRDGHVTESKEDIDVVKITCPTCKRVAKRHQVYRDQAVSFKGAGFTKSVVPPPRPLPQSSKGESPEIHFEKTDEYAEKSYRHGREYSEEIKKVQRERMEV
jgi:hypothetical protein